jgi:hypothetical protein
MFISDLPDIITPFIDANEPCQIASPPGCGKSESIEQYVDYRSQKDGFEWGLAKVFIASMSPVDMYGFMVAGNKTYKDYEGKEHTSRVSEFTMPPWMMSIKGIPMNAYRRGIVVFEEWDKGDPDTKKGSAEPILRGGLGVHQLHRGISRVVLVNRAEDRSGTTKNFDFIINRRGELNFMSSMPGWLKWAMTKGLDPLFTSFAERYPQVVFTNTVPEIQGPFVTPRSLVKVQNVLKRRLDPKGEVLIDDIAVEVAQGYLGSAATAQLMAWLRVKTETPAWTSIVNSPDTVKVPDRADACLMSCHEVAHHVDMKTATSAITYMRRMPKEFAMTFAVAAIHRLPRLIAAPAFTGWAKENRSLLNVLGGANK